MNQEKAKSLFQYESPTDTRWTSPRHQIVDVSIACPKSDTHQADFSATKPFSSTKVAPVP